ncbi:MAG: hypothetical protein EXR94_12925 [Gemmatimonadetes bacterium]|nr:hypothetical protein [Gemmatimonadota bacterium]
MKHHYWRRGAWLGLLLTACSSPDDTGPVGPHPEPGSRSSQSPAGAAGQSDPDRTRHDRLARRVARALRDPRFRQAVFDEIGRSGFAEKKVHLQGFMAKAGGTERRRLAHLSGDSEGAIQTDLDQGAAIEMYFPLPSHRRQWTGGPNLLVATAERDGESPVAYDLLGRRSQLSPASPPATPVLMVGRAETRFDRGPASVDDCPDCIFPPPPGGITLAPTAPGVYLTAAKFTGTFESWFKGSPEFEVHVLGQAGSTNGLTTYQCAGEQAGGPYQFDQNATNWTGNVMLFSPTQFDQYKVQHPGRNLRLFVVEDDDTACEIRIDSTRTTNLFDAVKLVYSDLTGAQDSTTGFGTRIIRKAPIYLRVIRAVTSWFKTNDDPVGNAVEDQVAASAFLPGANWLIKGERSITNGAVRLEYR